MYVRDAASQMGWGGVGCGAAQENRVPKDVPGMVRPWSTRWKNWHFSDFGVVMSVLNKGMTNLQGFCPQSFHTWWLYRCYQKGKTNKVMIELGQMTRTIRRMKLWTRKNWWPLALVVVMSLRKVFSGPIETSGKHPQCLAHDDHSSRFYLF